MRRKPLKCECVLEYMSEKQRHGNLRRQIILTLVPSEHSATGWYGVFLALGRNRPYGAHQRDWHPGVPRSLHDRVGGRTQSVWLGDSGRQGAGAWRTRNGPSNGRYKSADFAAPPMDEQTVHATAAEEGLTLVPARGGKSGWKGVLQHHEEAASFNASLEIGGCRVKLGHHRTALEAALAYARAPRPRGVEGGLRPCGVGRARALQGDSGDHLDRAMRDGAVRQDKQAIEDGDRDWREDTETLASRCVLAGAPALTAQSGERRSAGSRWATTTRARRARRRDGHTGAEAEACAAARR